MPPIPPELQKIIQDYIRPIKYHCKFCNTYVIKCKTCKFCNICGTKYNKMCHVCIFFVIYFIIFIKLTFIALVYVA